MVAHSEEHGTEASAAQAAESRHRRGRGGLRRLLTGSMRVVDLQLRLWLTQAKATLVRMALYAGLFAGALVLGILAIIFLCIGVFHVLTEVAGLPVWAAFLIFGGALALLAGGMIMIAGRLLAGGHDTDEASDQGGDES